MTPTFPSEAADAICSSFDIFDGMRYRYRRQQQVQVKQKQKQQSHYQEDKTEVRQPNVLGIPQEGENVSDPPMETNTVSAPNNWGDETRDLGSSLWDGKSQHWWTVQQ